MVIFHGHTIVFHQNVLVMNVRTEKSAAMASAQNIRNGKMKSQNQKSRLFERRLLSMNFYDTIAERGYTIKKEENTNLIHIVKEDGSSPVFVESHIVFHKSEKQIKGFLSVHDLIFDTNDTAIIYRMFRHMQEDLKFFAEKARYDII